MAEDDKTENTESTKVKRRLRSDPQTMRQRTETLQQERDRPDSAGRRAVGSFWYGFTWPLRWLGRQIAKLERFKVFRIIGLILLPRYIRNSWRELRLVTWPNFRQSWRLTYAVLIFSVIFGIVIAILDFGLDKLFKEFIIK